MEFSPFSEQSQWIWMKNAPEVNCYLEFERAFSLKEAADGILTVTVQGQYVILVDGVALDSTQYPDFPEQKAVQCISLPGLAVGSHTLQIQVWQPNADTSCTRRELPGLRYELRVGEYVCLCSAAGDPVRRLPGYQNDTIRDITVQMGAGFAWAQEQPAAWTEAVAVEKPCRFVPRPIPELTVGPLLPGKVVSQGIFAAHDSGLQQYAALSFREHWQLTRDGQTFTSPEGDGIYLILDLGRESVGYLDIDAVCPEKAKVEIGFGEHLEDLRVRTDVGGRHFTVEWEAGPERQRFCNRFRRLGCRYLQLFFRSRRVTLYHAGLLEVTYPMRGQSRFACSDRLLNRIFEVSGDTLRCSVHEHYEDCPWREQALYAFDSRNQMLFGYYAFGEFAQPRASLQTLACSLREDGLLELCAPARVGVDIPSFSLMFIVALEEYCRFSGDLSLAEELLPVAGTILRTFHNRLCEGVMHNLPGYWNFYEWMPGLSGDGPEGPDCALQLYYLLALQRMERICTYLGRATPHLAEEIKTVTDGLETFWDPAAGAYRTFPAGENGSHYSQLVQALALYTRACPAHRQEMLRKELNAEHLVPASLSASVFVYDALLQEPAVYGQWVMDEVARRWGAMLYRGATTFWETDIGAPDFDRAGSLCHGWSAVPAYLLGAYVLGVRPTAPGVWEADETLPALLPWARGTLPAPGGSLNVAKKQE